MYNKTKLKHKVRQKSKVTTLLKINNRKIKNKIKKKKKLMDTFFQILKHKWRKPNLLLWKKSHYKKQLKNTSFIQKMSRKNQKKLLMEKTLTRVQNLVRKTKKLLLTLKFPKLKMRYPMKIYKIT